MTVSSSTDRETFQGNGVTTSFPLPFRFFNNSDVQVQLINNATQESTPQTLGIHYSLSGAGEPEVDGNADSTLTMFVAPPVGLSLFAVRVMDPVQPTDIVNQGRFLPEIHENVFDRLTMLIQQAFGGLRNALLRPDGKNYYDAEGRQIKNLADPVADQDAATGGWVSRLIGSILETGQGPVNNAANVLYVYPDGSPRTVQSLSLAEGYKGIGYGASSDGLGGRLGRILVPESYGNNVGNGSAPADKAAWLALIADLRDGDTVRAQGVYQIQGSDLVVQGINSATFDFSGGRFLQLSNNSKTISFKSCVKLSIKDAAEFRGRGGAAGEYVPSSTSYNGVAGIFLEDCDYVQVTGNRLRDHAGGSIVWRNSDHLFINGNKVSGIGSAYIPALGNGQDFAIGGFSDYPTRMDFEFNISDNVIRGTAFGIFANRSKSLILTGNQISGIPGQHGVYTIECSGVVASGNTFRACAQSAFKMQLENYAGRGLAPVDQLDHTGLVYQGNTVINCQDGFALLSTSLSDNTDQKVFGLVLQGNSIVSCSQDSMQVNHAIGAIVSNNTLRGAVRFGLVFRNSSGVISGNSISGSGASGVTGSLYGDTFIHGNNIRDCGLNNQAGAGNDVPLLFSAPAAPLPSMAATPKLILSENQFRYSNTQNSAATVLSVLDTRIRLDVSGTGSDTNQPARCDGTLIAAEANDFPGFTAAALNSPATFTRGRVGRDFYGQQNPQMAGSTLPFIRGDICWNSNVSATGVVFWECVTAGSPGTWAVGATR